MADGHITYVDKGDARVVRERKQTVVDRELDRLYQRDGTVSAELLVEEARKKRSPLHEFFEWDDSEAARRYRLNQATQLILASKMVVLLENDRQDQRAIAAQRPQTVRKFLSPGRKEPRKLRNEGLQDDDFRQAVIDRHVTKLRSWCRETVDIEELKQLRTGILKMVDKLS